MMRFTKTKAVLAAVSLSFALAACGGGEGVDVEVEENPDFESGTTMAKLANSGKVTIGVKFDQPGIGYKEPGADEPTGFDIEMGKVLAAELGIAPEDIEWKETVS